MHYEILAHHSSAVGHGSHLHRGRPEAVKPLPQDATIPRLGEDDRGARVWTVVDVVVCLADVDCEANANVEDDRCELIPSSLAEASGGTP